MATLPDDPGRERSDVTLVPAVALTPKQQRFVKEYLLDLNATAAYRRAGYQASTDNAAAASASALLRNPKIEAAVAEEKAKRSERTEITQDFVLRGLKIEAEFYGEGASHSARVTAFTQLGKHLGMFREVVDHNLRLAVVEDEGWYGNRAHESANAAQGAPPPAADTPPPSPQ